MSQITPKEVLQLTNIPDSFTNIVFRHSLSISFTGLFKDSPLIIYFKEADSLWSRFFSQLVYLA